MVSMGVFLWSRGADCVLVRGPNGWKSVTHIYEYLFESRGNGLGCKACGRKFVRFWVFEVGSGFETGWALVGASAVRYRGGVGLLGLNSGLCEAGLQPVYIRRRAKMATTHGRDLVPSIHLSEAAGS